MPIDYLNRFLLQLVFTKCIIYTSLMVLSEKKAAVTFNLS
jgi:hypothetical protein